MHLTLTKSSCNLYENGDNGALFRDFRLNEFWWIRRVNGTSYLISYILVQYNCAVFFPSEWIQPNGMRQIEQLYFDKYQLNNETEKKNIKHESIQLREHFNEIHYSLDLFVSVWCGLVYGFERRTSKKKAHWNYLREHKWMGKWWPKKTNRNNNQTLKDRQ